MKASFPAALVCASLFSLVVLVCCSSVSAQTPQEGPADSGNAFVRLCSVIDKDDAGKTSLEGMHEVACLGYINGLTQGIDAGIMFAQVSDKSLPKPYCLSSEAEMGQLIRVVLKYIKGNPEMAHLPTVALAMLALQQAFPCR